MIIPTRSRRCATVAAILAVVAWFPGCGSGAPGDAKGGGKSPPLVAAEAARRETLTRTLDLTGETVAVETAVVSATVEGTIRFCPWREGDVVESSPETPTRLVEIDRELYRAEVRAAEAALHVARAKLDDMKTGTRPEEIAKAAEEVRRLTESTSFAQSDMERIRQLVESGSLPGEVLEKARVEHVGEKARLDAAHRHLQMLEAGFTKTAIAVQEAIVAESASKLDLARARLAECVISAPFAGTITRVFVRPGDLASPKTPLLEISDLGSLVVRVAIAEANAAEVKVGLPARVRPDALGGTALPGRVTRVFPDLDRRMRTRTVEISVDDARALLPDMFARVALEIGSVPGAVTVPSAAVVATPSGEKTIFVLTDGHAALRKVCTGIEHAGRVQVIEGLDEGEAVITLGQGRLRDGAAVRITPPAGGSGSKGQTK